MISEEQLAQIRDTIVRFPQKRSAVLPVLHLVQEELGWLSPEAQDYVAELIGLPPIKVHEVASFYTLFNKKPVGRYHLQVCTNIACMLRNSGEILQAIQERLGIKPGETTADQRFSVSTVECLAACGGAPAMQVNSDYVENLTATRLTAYLEELP